MESSQKTQEAENSFDEYYEQLPKDTRFGPELVYHQTFWCPAHLLRPILSIQTHFQARPTDLFITGMLKTGNTWLKSLVFATINRHHQPISDSLLLKHNPHDLIPTLEMVPYLEGASPDLDKALTLQASCTTRLLSTHLPFEALPKSIIDSGCKMIYICRNPLDAFVSSWFFFIKGVFDNKENSSLREGRSLPSMEEYFELYLQGVTPFGPFFDHVLGYWNKSVEMPHKILFIKYEELLEDTTSQLKRIADFLGDQFSQEEEQGGMITEIVKMCGINSLKELMVNKEGRNRFGNNNVFFRNGKVGDWANHLTPSMVDDMHKLMHEKFDGLGLSLKETMF